MADGLYLWNDTILVNQDHGDKIAADQACCCTGTGCCPGLPTTATLQLVVTNVSDCGCADGLAVTLTYDGTLQCWVGTGPGGGGCGLLSVTWRLCCVTASLGCGGYQLSESGGVCISTPTMSDPDTCACDPLHLEFDMTFTGLGCCDGSPGSVHIEIDEL